MLNASITKKSKWRRIIGALTLDVSPLRVSRDYRLLFTGQLVSGFGSAMSYVVLPFQMYQLTKSSLAVGMLGVAEFVPMLTLGFVGGALADYFDRRKLLWIAEVGLMLCVGVLIFNSLLASPKVWVLFMASALFAALNALHRPAMEALTPKIVAAEFMPAVAALNSLRFNFSFILGPAVGGVLAASFGVALAYGVDLVTYVVSLAALLLMRAVPPPEDPDRPSLQSVIDGLRYARSRQELLGTYLIDLNAMFFGMPMALFPAMAESYGSASVGLFYSMPSIGALCATLTSGWTARIRKHGLAITIAASVWGLAIVGAGLAKHLWLGLFFLALAGCADMISGLFRMTLWNQTIPDYLRGRMASIEMISYTTGPYLGNAEAGIVASLFGLRASVVSGGVLCVAGSALLAMFLPRFIRYDREEGLARKEIDEAARAVSGVEV
ncbi:MAG: MFS transporter [Acidobacteriota bacterium]